MRFELMCTLALTSCAVSLDDEDPTSTRDTTPTLASCVALAEAPFVGATGGVRSITFDDQLYLVADALHTSAASVSNALVVAPLPANDMCLAVASDPSDALDTRALGDVAAGVTALFASDTELFAFVRTFEGLTAIGTTLARFDPDSARFVVSDRYLFAAEGRPSYGEAALVDDGFVYTYGVAHAGFFEEDCFVARAPLDAVDDPTAWTYYSDGDLFVDDADDAWPIFSGGGGLAVTRLGDRVLVAYHTPLGDTVLVRTGLGPTGPWSAAAPVTRCDSPDGAFCGALAFHPALTSDTDLTLTYGIASFDPLTLTQRLTRAVRLPSP